MIQWCQDCKHDYGFEGWQAKYCDTCLENSELGMKPIGYEQIEQVDPEESDESEPIDNILFILNKIWICGGIKNYSDYCELHDAIRAMDRLELKTGKWVYKITDAYIQRTCSACGWSERMYYYNRNQDGLIRNYCPNCGCKMEVKE